MSFRIRALTAVLAVSCAPWVRSEGLSFADALDRASREAPAVAAGADRVDAAEQAARAAGKFPDPKLMLGLDNLPVTGRDSYSLSSDSMTMRRIGIAQDLPSSAKRSAERALAQGQIELAQSELRVTRLAATEQVAAAWIARQTLERQLSRLDDLDAENRLLEAAVRARLAAGLGSPVETVAVRQEAAMLTERRDALSARRDQAIAQLRRWVGAAADEPLLGEAPVYQLERASLLNNVAHHPALAALGAQAAVLDSEIATANAARHPDWSLELAYQKRAPVFGDMVSLQLSVNLPIFPGSRQTPRIEARRAERRALDGEREAELREHQQMLEADLIEQQRLQKAVDRQRAVVLPLAQEKVELLQSAWRANKATLAEVIGARQEKVEAEIALLELQGTSQSGLASLHLRYAAHTGEQ